MARRSQRMRLLDIAAQMTAIEAALVDRAAEDLRADWLLRSAIERGVEIISESSRHLDAALIAAHPAIPWRRVADIGNWLRHAYEQVDPALILAIVTDHFPALHLAVAEMLTQIPED